MSFVKPPVYDEDIATKAYVDSTLKESIEDVEGQISSSGGNRNFGSTPTTPYYVNDTWTENGVIHICIHERLIGDYDPSDWSVVTDTTEYDEFINTTYPRDKALLQQEIDGKINTYIQVNDPSLDWDTALEKEKHIGDFWRKQLDTATSFETYIYTKFNTNPITYGWSLQDVPPEVWDAIDGKKTIFTSKPTEYDVDDLWIVGTSDTDLPDGCVAGDYLVATKSNTQYNKTDWKKANSNVDIEQITPYVYTKTEIDESVEKGPINAQITNTVNGLRSEVERTYTTIEATTTIETTIQNDYYNANQVDEKITTTTKDIESKYTTAIEQSENNVTARVTQQITADGVSKLKNSLITIDINGINVAVNTSAFNTQITNEGFYCRDSATIVAKIDRGGLLANNPKLNGKIEECGLIQKTEYTHSTFGKGLAHFYMG